jgi:hypothetical protein
MPAPFEALEDRLLRGGIAPRHVKRYLRELSEHLADLTEAERATGHEGPDARARAALGPDAELADAMLKQRDFRSLSARFPWLVFGVMPPLAVFAGFILWAMLLVALGFASGAIIPHQKVHLPTPAWYNWAAGGLMFAANLLIGTSLAWLLAWVAQRQRLRLLWPLLGIALILILGLHGMFHVGNKIVSFGLSTVFPFVPKMFGSAGPIHWPTFLAQAALLCLPLAWLVHMRRKTAAE